MEKRLNRLSRRLILFFVGVLTVLATITVGSFSLLHPQTVNAQQVSRGNGYVSISLPSTGNQNDNWSCGPNSAARVLAFYGHNVNYSTVRSAVNQEFMLPPSVNVPSPTLTDPFRTRRVDIRTGTTPHVLRDVMRRWEGNNVRLERGANFSSLLNLVRDGKPVVSLLRVGSIPPQTTLSGTWPELHWVAVHGFNESERMVYYTDTDGGRYQKSYDEFQSQWDWRVGAGFASEALHRNGVQARTIIWVDRVVGNTTASNPPTTTPPINLVSGYFRRSDRPEVYFVNAGNRTACHVQNPSQMEVYGGFGQVQTVQGDGFRSGAQFTGSCAWPDGLYRSSDRPEVYYLHNNWRSACWVRTPERVEQLGGWGRVRLINNTSRESLTVGRSYSERC